MFEYSGNIHIHSAYSDGRLSIKEIAREAKKAGLNFIIITDHNNLDGLVNQQEGYYNDVLVLVGMEVNDICNHYLALDISKVVLKNTRHPQHVIDGVNSQKGIGIIAHPVEKGSPYINEGRTYPWKDWTVEGYQGIEIWNFLSQWRDEITNIFRGIQLLINPVAALKKGAQSGALAIYDQQVSQGKKIIAVGSSDAHGYQVGLGPVKIKIGGYDISFRTINMHILSKEALTGDANEDKYKVYEALRCGCAWISNDYYLNSRGFRYQIKDRNKVWQMGDKATYNPGMIAEIKTPVSTRVVLYRNGRRVGENTGNEHCFNITQPGIYRSQAFIKYKAHFLPWIYSNPIWLEKI